MSAGKLTYLEIPASDGAKAARFYAGVCGWQIDKRSDDDYRFEDKAAGLIGRWRVDRAASASGAGIVPYVTVASVADAVARVAELGGDIVDAPAPDGDLVIARVRDPAGNVIGLWQFA